MCRVVWAELCLKTPVDSPQITEWWKEVHTSVVFVRMIGLFMPRSKERYCYPPILLSQQSVWSTFGSRQHVFRTTELYLTQPLVVQKKRMKKCTHVMMKCKMLQFIIVIQAGSFAQASSRLGYHFIVLFFSHYLNRPVDSSDIYPLVNLALVRTHCFSLCGKTAAGFVNSSPLLMWPWTCQPEQKDVFNESIYCCFNAYDLHKENIWI